MKNNVSWAKALGAGGWAILILLLAFLITAIAAIGIENWDWNLFPQVFENLWEVFVAVLVFSTILVIFLYKYPLQTLSFGLSTIAILLVVASYKSSSIGESIRSYIDSNYDINYIATGVILIALLLTFIAIYRTQVSANKIKAAEAETPKDEAPRAEPVKDEAPEVEPVKDKVPIAESVKNEAPKAETPRDEAPIAESVKDEAPEAETPKDEALKYKGLSKDYKNLKLTDE